MNITFVFYIMCFLIFGLDQSHVTFSHVMVDLTWCLLQWFTSAPGVLCLFGSRLSVALLCFGVPLPPPHMMVADGVLTWPEILRLSRMSTSFIPDWLVLPEEILSEIWLMVGLESLESLHRCRQVCQTWNELIMKNIWKNPSKRNIIATRIQRNWGPGTLPSSEDISHAKWLGNKEYCADLFITLYSFFL